MSKPCNLRTHIALHDLFLASVNNERKLTPSEFAKSIDLLLNNQYETALSFGCHDTQVKRHHSLCIRKETGFFKTNFIVKI